MTQTLSEPLWKRLWMLARHPHRCAFPDGVQTTLCYLPLLVALPTLGLNLWHLLGAMVFAGYVIATLSYYDRPLAKIVRTSITASYLRCWPSPPDSVT